MIALMIAAAMTVAQPEGATARWVWTLYENEGEVVLANEIPDTPRLRATLECRPRSDVARVTVYEAAGARGGFVDLTAGQDRATAEGETGQDGASPWLVAPVRLDHPVFAAFLESGTLTLAQGEHRWQVSIPSGRRAALNRFAELCGG